jgi:hypothetical protein
VQGLLVTWGKIVDATKANDTLWALVREGQQQYWKASPDGSIRLVPEYVTELSPILRNLTVLIPGQKKSEGWIYLLQKT